MEKLCKDCRNLMKPVKGGVLNYVHGIPFDVQDSYIEYECPHCNYRLREEITRKWSRNI